MVTLHDANSIAQTSSGINITRYCKSAKVKEILNGTFTVEIELVFNPMLWNTITREMQVRVPTHRGKDLTFRIKEINKNQKTLKLTCRHIFWDLENNFIEDIYPKGMGGQEALQYILDHGNYQTQWKGESNIITQKNCRIVRQSQLNAIMGKDDNTFKSRWGGELTIDDYLITMSTRRGSMTPIQIKFGKDINGFEFYEDISELATRIMPEGANGLLLPEKYIDSPLIGAYSMPYIRKIKMDDIKVASDEEGADNSGAFASAEEAYVEMRKRVNEQLFSEQEIDKPKQNIRAELKTLRESVQYKKYGFHKLEGIQLGDPVEVDISDYNIIASKRCISIEFDCLTEKYIEVELGEFKLSDTSTENDFVAPELDIDGKLETYKSGMFFHRNSSSLTINANRTEACFLSFGTTIDTHLQLTVCVVGTSSDIGTGTMTIYVDNKPMEVIPKQVFAKGEFTWTIALPLLFVTGQRAHSLSISLDSTSTLTVPINNFVVTVYGQSIAGGASATVPHAEVVEEVPPGVAYNKVSSCLSDTVAINDVAITRVNNLVDKIQTEYSEVSTNMTDSASVNIKHLGFQSVWSWDNYETDSSDYTMDNNGISYNSEQVTAKNTLAYTGKGQDGSEFSVIEIELPSSDVYYAIGKGEVK